MIDYLLVLYVIQITFGHRTKVNKFKHVDPFVCRVYSIKIHILYANVKFVHNEYKNSTKRKNPKIFFKFWPFN